MGIELASLYKFVLIELFNQVKKNMKKSNHIMINNAIKSIEILPVQIKTCWSD